MVSWQKINLWSLASIAANKSPGNDDLTKEFYYTFWKKLKIFLWNLSKNQKKKDKNQDKQ